MKLSIPLKSEDRPDLRQRFSPYRLLQRKASRYTIGRVGFSIRQAADRQRADRVIRAFFIGYNHSVIEPSAAASLEKCRQLTPFFRPFAHEGACCGHFGRNFWRPGFNPQCLIDRFRAVDDSYKFLYGLGLGFGCGAYLGPWTGRVERLLEALKPEDRQLAYNGYGFQFGLMRFDGRLNRLERLQRFGDDSSVRSCYQGFGRSLRFLLLDDHQRMNDIIEALGPDFRSDIYSGLGLAIGFTFADRIGYGLSYADHLPDREARTDYFAGIGLAFFSRRQTDRDYLHQRFQELTDAERRAAERILKLCEDCGAGIDLAQPDSYIRWQRQLRGKLSETNAVFDR